MNIRSWIFRPGTRPAGSGPVAADGDTGPAGDKLTEQGRWLANYGLSLAAADYAIPAPETSGGCPLRRLLPAPRTLR